MRHLLRRHRRYLPVQLLEESVEHRLAQHLQKLLELVLRLRVHELVVLERLHLPAHVRRQRLQVLLLALDDVLQHLRELALGLTVARRRFRAVALGGRTFAQSLARLLQATSQRALLHAQDLVQPLPDVLDDGSEVVAVEHLATPLTQPSQQLLEAGETLSLLVLQAALEQVAQRLLEIAEVHEVVGDRVEQVIRVERWDFLRSVPAGVAVFAHLSLCTARGRTLCLC